ncbi:MAG: polysaccharide deacetylase family protein [bacterium]|nr:polysaccharide deacetylase family protein [bacterium]
MLPILLYHEVTDFDFSGTWVTPHQFESQMRYLHKNGYTTITPYEIISTGSFGNSKSSIHNSNILITFDDGYESFYYKALPILLRYGFRATIFVVTNYIGRENLWDVSIGRRRRHISLAQLDELKKYGFIIGSHTRMHPDLTKIRLNQAKDEILNSKLELEDKLGSKVDFISYPFGRYNATILDLVKEAGYRLSFTSNPFVNSKSVLGRMGVYIIDSLANFKSKLYKKDSVYRTFEATKSVVINSLSPGTWIWKTLNPFSKGCI